MRTSTILCILALLAFSALAVNNRRFDLKRAHHQDDRYLQLRHHQDNSEESSDSETSTSTSSSTSSSSTSSSTETSTSRSSSSSEPTPKSISSESSSSKSSSTSQSSSSSSGDSSSKSSSTESSDSTSSCSEAPKKVLPTPPKPIPQPAADSIEGVDEPLPEDLGLAVYLAMRDDETAAQTAPEVKAEEVAVVNTALPEPDIVDAPVLAEPLYGAMGPNQVITYVIPEPLPVEFVDPMPATDLPVGDVLDIEMVRRDAVLYNVAAGSSEVDVQDDADEGELVPVSTAEVNWMEPVTVIVEDEAVDEQPVPEEVPQDDTPVEGPVNNEAPGEDVVAIPISAPVVIPVEEEEEDCPEEEEDTECSESSSSSSSSTSSSSWSTTWDDSSSFWSDDSWFSSTESSEDSDEDEENEDCKEKNEEEEDDEDEDEDEDCDEKPRKHKHHHHKHGKRDHSQRGDKKGQH